MDPLTHTACGVFLGRAGLNRWSPGAAAVLMLAANAPDIDLLTAAGGSLTYLNWHRHFTHSIVAAPFLAILPVVVVRLVSRKPLAWRGAYFASLLAIASHLLLDYTNIYGIRLFLPFSNSWLRLDVTGVVDFWIWGIVAVCLLGPLLGRLVGSEISSGTARSRHHGRGFAILALCFLTFYDLGRLWLHDRAVAVLESRVYRGWPPVRTVALPDAANPLRWIGVVETQEFFAVADVNLAGDFDPNRALVFHKAAPNPAVAAAIQSPVFADFLRFAQFPIWRVLPDPDGGAGQRVEVMDMRFGTPLRPGFVVGALVSPEMRVTGARFSFGAAPAR